MKRVLVPVITLAALAGCGDGTAPAGDRQVSLSLTSGTASPTLSVAAGDTIVLGGNTLVLDQVQLVLREIELKRVETAACDSAVGDDDQCEEFETGPVLVSLPLDGSVATLLSVVVDTGTYRELEFKLHKPEDHDTAFLGAHPDFADITVRVTGTYNGTPFTYETDLDAEQEMDLVPPLVISDASVATNVTLRVDVRSWFLVNGGVVNPASANKGGANESAVNENVKNSFKAFEDHDRDGHESNDH